MGLVWSLNDKTILNTITNENGMPILVDFWATWCGPCRQISPIIDEIAEKYKDKLIVCKFNVDENKSAHDFGVSSLPTVLIFKNGEIVNKVIGSFTKSKIYGILDKIV